MQQQAVDLPHADVFERALSSRVAERKAREVVAQAGQRYAELYAQREQYANRSLREHLEEGILPGIALYQALLNDGETQDQAMPLLELAFEAWAALDRQRMERLARLPGFYWLLRATIGPIMRSSYPEEGWQIEWLEKSGEAIAFNMKSCFYQDVLERYGLPELTPLYCLRDDQVYEDLTPKVRWARTRTLGRGDDCCDFRFERVRRP